MNPNLCVARLNAVERAQAELRCKNSAVPMAVSEKAA